MTTIVVDPSAGMFYADRAATWINKYCSRTRKLRINDRGWLTALAGSMIYEDELTALSIRAIEVGVNYFELPFEVDGELALGTPSGSVFWIHVEKAAEKWIAHVARVSDPMMLAFGSGQTIAQHLFLKARLPVAACFMVAASIDAHSGESFGADTAVFQSGSWQVREFSPPAGDVKLTFTSNLGPPTSAA